MAAISREAVSSDVPIDLCSIESKYIFCRTGYETVVEELRRDKIKLPRSFVVLHAEAVDILVPTQL